LGLMELVSPAMMKECHVCCNGLTY
jgi:hypothetical protein